MGIHRRSFAAVATGALVFLHAFAPVWAKTQAECKREYATKKPAGQSKASYVKACLAAVDPPPAAGAAPSQGGGDANKLREAAQNPVADLISVQFQDNPAFNYGPYNGTQNVLNFSRSFPSILMRTGTSLSGRSRRSFISRGSHPTSDRSSDLATSSRSFFFLPPIQASSSGGWDPRFICPPPPTKP